MKKNKMMRLASVLLVAVLMTTSVISGTFAKYVTASTGEDDARVAKWGVSLSTSSPDLFKETYETQGVVSDASITHSVAVDTAGTDLVAPGTSGSFNFSIAGKPEVAVKVDFAMDVDSDVIIPKNTEVADGVTLDKDYTPVVFTLSKAGVVDPIATGSLTAIKTGLVALADEYGPNSDALAGTYTLSWVWDYEGTNTINAADTYLGNVAANPALDANTSTVIDFDFTITVTQID